MKTRRGANGGTFRATGLRPAAKIPAESLEAYLAGLSADQRAALQYEPAPTPKPEGSAPEAERLVEPVKIEVEGLRWVVARVAPGSELRVARDLAAQGYRPYCPLGRKLALRARVSRGGVERRGRRMRQFVVFAPYLFVGCAPGQEIGREIYNGFGERVGVVLGDARKPTPVAPRIIEEINKLEVAGQWWANWRGQTHLRTGGRVRVLDGPFADFEGIVEALPAEMRVRVSLSLFGGATPATFNACQVEPV
jgi:transcriptional antiterminator NusG